MANGTGNIEISKEAYLKAGKGARGSEAQREMVFDGIVAIRNDLKPIAEQQPKNTSSIRWLTWGMRLVILSLIIGTAFYFVR